ncbi:MAG: 3-dehydroquinate synthase [Weeksellaceae bacterium]
MMQSRVYFDDLRELKALLQQFNSKEIFVLTDEHTFKHCLPKFMSAIGFEKAPMIIQLPAGEENKTLKNTQKIWQILSENACSRNGLLLNLGGGMITDIGGFAASVYKRGIPYIHFPTSLLAMVDAAVGGKTGVDMNGVKNIIGTFSMPVATVVIPEFLETLPEREFRSGLAEMLKHGLIWDAAQWKKIIQLDYFNPENIVSLIQESVNIKLEITTKDPLEKDLRKILNFGHTIGHAVESEFLNSENPLLHGEAIAVGILVESVLSFENNLISQAELDEIFTHIIRIFGKTKLPEIKFPKLLEWMKNDKKNQNLEIGFSLLKGIGSCVNDVYLNENQIIVGVRNYNLKLADFN